jgi:tRNA nucleotidyltransferase/poly(A) polymerase
MANAAEFVMEGLRRAGYEAYLVGGCVRDILLQRTPKDFDVTTNALPEQVTALFPRTIPVGAKFGVTVVMVGDEQIEVATYRADGAYTDGRRPDTVEYGKSAEDDVTRRDFTMNGLLCLGQADDSSATAYAASLAKADRYVSVGGKTYGIVDYVGGYADIERGVIRAIGDPNKRFEEDALRMIRAVRFAAQLGFDVEVRTMEAIERNAPLLEKISKERIAAELFKMFSAPFPLKGLIPFISTGMYAYCLPNEKYSFAKHANMLFMMRRFGKFTAEKDPMLGMAMFFADIESHADTHMAQFLKLSSEQQQELVYMNSHVITFRQHLSGPRELSEAAIKRALRQPGVSLALEIMTQNELIGKTSLGIEAVMGFVLKLKAYKPEDIKPTPLVTGKDLIADGIPPGPLFSGILYDIESMQLNGFMTTREQAMEFVRARVYQDDKKEWVYTGLSTQEFARTQ